ncbi:MAG: glucoamylase family protein, partial [Granulicella sp.]
NTLISRSLGAAASIQRDHGRSLHRGNIPWGISESGFAATDALGRYGYHAWGIPGLALKYGADDGPVISPYSSFLVLSLLRRDALTNLRKMEALGWVGAYGFYEAADYIDGSEPQLVRSWMAHHQGMSLLALLNILRDNIVQQWFHANPRVRAAELLLHEKQLSKDNLTALAKLAKQHDLLEKAAESNEAA